MKWPSECNEWCQLLCSPYSPSLLTLNLWFVLLLWRKMIIKWLTSLFFFQPIVVTMKMLIATVNSWKTNWAVKILSPRTIARLPAIAQTKFIKRSIQTEHDEVAESHSIYLHLTFISKEIIDVLAINLIPNKFDSNVFFSWACFLFYRNLFHTKS